MIKGFITKNGPVFGKILPASSEYCPIFEHKIRSDYIPVTVLTAEEVSQIKYNIQDAIKILKSQMYSNMAKALDDSLKILEGE